MVEMNANSQCWQLALGGGSACLLRPVRLVDVEAVHAAVIETVPELTQWFDWCRPDWPLEEARAMVVRNVAEHADGRSYNFVAVTPAGEVMGAAWLNRVDGQHLFCNLGYWVRSSQVGQGVATAAARQLAHWGFEHLSLRRIEIVVDVENLASQRVAVKLGARREGMLRWRLVHHGQPHDAVMYSLLRRDLERD